MKAIILGGGFSTRLYPRTKFFPKGLLPIKGKPLIEYALGDLLAIPEIDAVVLVTNNRYKTHFAKWLKNSRFASKIQLVNDLVDRPEDRLGSIGDLILVLTKLKWNDDLYVITTDTLTSITHKDILKFFHAHRGVVTTVFDTHDPDFIRGRLGCAVVSGIRIIRFVEKPENPPSTLTAVPIYVYPREVIPLIRQFARSNKDNKKLLDAPGSILAWLTDKTTVYAYNIGNGYYLNVGTNGLYEKIKDTGASSQ